MASSTPVISPTEIASPEDDLGLDTDQPWIVLVWNDPINTMEYVTLVFQKLFGYSKEKAEKLMLDVHLMGRAVVSTGPREKMESDTEALQGYGLWATFQKDT